MKYYKYRFSKYDPAYKDENGCYLKADWTSICDIGRAFDGVNLTVEVFYSVLQRYVEVISFLMKQCGVSVMIVSQLEKYTEDCMWKEGDEVDFETALVICKFMLEEKLWCHLYSRKTHFVLSCEYDFYLHVICRELNEFELSRIGEYGLFTEVL